MSRAASGTRLAVVGGVLAGLLFHALAWGGLEGFVQRMDFNQALFEDFMGPYFEQGLAIRSGDPRPVSGFLYTPFFAILMSYLAALGPQAASWIWLAVLGVSCLVLLALGPLARSLAGSPRLSTPWAGLLAFAGVTCLPLLHGLYWGQVSAPLTACLLGGAFLVARGRSFEGGALVGVAAAIKLYPLAFGLLLLARGRRQALAGMVGAFLLAAVGLPLLQLGPAVTADFYRQLGRALALRQEGWASSETGQYLGAVLARLLGHSHGQAWPGWLVVTLPRVLALALAASLIRTLQRDSSSTALLRATAAFACGLPLWLEPAWMHYFAWLPMAQVLALGPSPLARLCAGISVLLSSAVLFRALPSHADYGSRGLLCWASLVLLLPLLRRPRP